MIPAEQPRMLLVAGPNGAGRATVIEWGGYPLKFSMAFDQVMTV